MPVEKIVFQGVPLPPSSNNQYVSFVRAGKVKHVAAESLMAFKKAMSDYQLMNASLFKIGREVLSGHPIQVHVIFRFQKSRVLSKEGHFKKLDVSNRLKALHDAFAKALLVDDCAFVRVSAEKRAVHDKCREGAAVAFSICDFVEETSLL